MMRATTRAFLLAGGVLLALSSGCRRWDMSGLERREFYVMKPGYGEREGLTPDEALVLAMSLAKPSEGKRRGRGAVTIETAWGKTMVLAHRDSINDFVKRWSNGKGLDAKYFGKYEVRSKHKEVYKGDSAGAALLVAEQLSWREESESLTDIRIIGPDLHDYMIIDKAHLDGIFDDARKFESWKIDDLADRFEFADRLLLEYHVETGEVDDMLAELERHADEIRDSKTKRVAAEARKILDRVNECYDRTDLEK